MRLHSDSFRPYHWLDERLAFGKHDPKTHIALSDNKNPHLAWSEVPLHTRSFAILGWDPDVPARADGVNQEGHVVPDDLPRMDFFHWVVVDLPAGLRDIEEGSHSSGITTRGKKLGSTREGGRAGLNDYTNWFAGDADMKGDYAGYDGPCPPWNDERVHGYRFAVYALDVPTLLVEGRFTGGDVRRAMRNHVLGQATTAGLYAINPKARF